MALSSPSTAPSYPGLSSSLSSFLSTLQCHVDDSSSSLLQSLYPDSQDSGLHNGRNGSLENSQQLSQSFEDSLGSDTLLGYLQMLDSEPLDHGLSDMTFSPRPYSMAAEPRLSQQEQAHPEPLMGAAWEAEQLQLLLGITMDETDQLRGNVAKEAQPFPAAQIKKPDAKEAFVHPGFYSLSSSSNGGSSLSTPSPTPPQAARKRSLQEEGTSADKRPMDGRQHHLLPCGTDIRRHSLDTQLSSKPMAALKPHSWACATPPRSPPNASLYFISQLQHQRQHQQKLLDQTDVPPGQPYMAAISSPQPSPFLQHTLLSRHHSPAQNMSSMPSSLSPSSLLLSPSGSPLQQQRKRRASKARMGSELQYPLQFPINAVPPPLQQHHHRQQHRQHQHQYQPYLQPPYPTQTLANFHKLPENHYLHQQQQQQQHQQQQHHQQHHQQQHQQQQQRQQQHQQQQQHPRSQFPPQHPFSSRATTTGTNGSPSCRRNPGEVPSSTLPPDHFVFQEALFGIRRGYSLSTPLAAIADAAARRRSEPAALSDMSLKASAAWASTLAPSASSSSSFSFPTSTSCTLITSSPSLPLAIKEVRGAQSERPAASSSTKMTPVPAESATTPEEEEEEEEGLERPADTTMADQARTAAAATGTTGTAAREAEDLSAAATFAQSLSTVTTLDPAATKLIDQLRLQEYLRLVKPTAASSSPSSTMASSIVASSTLF